VRDGVRLILAVLGVFVLGIVVFALSVNAIQYLMGQ
jgi:hypothetical protein